ncbi:MAG: hypothetical protein ACR2K3_11240 [Nocardioides sp.]
MRLSHPRGRALASVTTALGLCLSAAAIAGTAPTQAAAPAQGTCDTAYPVASLAKGQAVTGQTVSSGTTPEGFTGDVLGVLKDGIEPGVDMVLVRLGSTEIDRVGGIWEGMSGSPVYAADGRLIGAVAYGLAYGTTPVAGVTPWADMQDYTGSAAAKHVAIGDGLARTIARGSDVTAQQAGQGMAQLQEPLGVAGVGQRVLNHQRKRPYLSQHSYATGRATGSAAPTAADVIAGGNLAATMSTGDITSGGVGTVTSACNGVVVGFGHPMNFLGKTTYGLAGADAIYVQEDPLGVPFKVANIGDPVGTITQDRMTGITGSLGAAPASIPLTSKVTYGTRSRTGKSQIQLPEAGASTTYYEVVSNHLATIDAYAGGSELQRWKVTGHTASGPFTIAHTNRYADPGDLIDTATWDIPDLVWLLSNVDGVTIDSIKDTATVSDDASSYTLVGIQQRRGGTWQTVKKGSPALAKSGHKLVMRAVLKGSDGTVSYSRFSFMLPHWAQPGTVARGFLESSWGYPFEQDFPSTLKGVQKLNDNMVRNDQLQVGLDLFKRHHHVSKSKRSAPADKVVHGGKAFKVKLVS